MGDSSAENESVGTLAASHAAEQGRVEPTPIVVSSDNESNLKVCLRRGWRCGPSAAALELDPAACARGPGAPAVVHVPDPQMPTDFLTKWVTRAKVAESLVYLMGSDRRVPPSRQ